ncbi:hypothetical protein O7A70_30425 [Mesorhizobium sp. Cs1299R1N1]|uniref:hypothetical protein n=1 Tax=Mesorhizobium sp. Cs1299R1N1 TaxID=3015172 RepID=UPI00301D6461
MRFIPNDRDGPLTQGIGIGLSQRFYRTLVAPIIQEHFPDLSHAACRIGLGSEVLGYDTEMSADHDYGPCLQIFLPEAEFSATADRMMQIFDHMLPDRFEGWTVRYPTNVRPPGVDAREPGMLALTTASISIRWGHGVIFFLAANLQRTSRRAIGYRIRNSCSCR